MNVRQAKKTKSGKLNFSETGYDIGMSESLENYCTGTGNISDTIHAQSLSLSKSTERFVSVAEPTPTTGTQQNMSITA